MNRLRYCAGLVYLSLIICLDLLLGTGEPATFDGPIHITNIAQFYQVLKSGDFPVAWANNLSNYGAATPIVAQQLPNYVGALIMFGFPHPVMVYKVLITVGYILASLAVYFFLRRYVKAEAAFAGGALYAFSAYRILNLYIRGAGPELLAAMWIPVILIAIDKVGKAEKHGGKLLCFSLTSLLLTHPLIFVVAQFVVIPFLLMEVVKTKKYPVVVTYTLSLALAGGIAAYYLVPLVLEMKYFVISRKTTQLIPDQTVSWTHYFQEQWQYYGLNDIFVRQNRIQFGWIESVILLSLLLYVFRWKRLPSSSRLFLVWVYAEVMFLVFLTTAPSEWLYRHIPYLDSLQFPWRMFNGLAIFPPLVLALWIEAIRDRRLKWIVICGVLVLVAWWRLPAAYGKNYTLYPNHHYEQTTKNLYLDEMNTLWTGATHEYPPRQTQAAVISGTGRLDILALSNSHRHYRIEASTPMRLVDYTFYFPGWQVVSDSQPIPIEFQDEQYRGMITYSLPTGVHDVQVSFKPTRIRLVGMWISGSTLLLLCFYGIYHYRQRH